MFFCFVNHSDEVSFPMRSLPLLFLDDHIAVINKPSGLLTHRTNIDRHETLFAMQILRDQLGKWVYPLHRLDKSTSGAMVFALDQETARRMTESFMSGRVSKSYLAVVRGVAKESERIDYPMKDLPDKMPGGEGLDDKKGREAVTEYRRLASVELPYPVGRYSSARFSLIRAVPLTGRTHQIRRHLKHVFHPIIGDTTYGDGKQNAFFRSRFSCHRLLLHAMDISFPHPQTGCSLHVHAPLDNVFGALLKTLDWDAVTLS